MSLVRSTGLLLLLALARLPAADLVTVVAAQSTIAIHGSSTLHDFDGGAKVVGGAFDLGAGKGMVEADATSLATGSEGRDAKMHSEIMVTATYPRVRFDLTRFEATPGGGTAHGLWSMHGVIRELSIPLTIASAGTPPLRHARATFDLDIRRWSIPVPRVLLITVDPLIKVTIDLALQDDAAAVLAPAPVREVAGLTLPDAAGTARALGGDRPLVICDTDGYSEAKRWAASLGGRLPATRQPLVVVMDDALAEGKRAKWTGRAPPGALFDWSASLRRRLQLPAAPLQVVVLDAASAVAGVVDGEADEAAVATVAALLRLPAK